MRPLGFVICCTDYLYPLCTNGKIYPYYDIKRTNTDGDYKIKIKDNGGDFDYWWMHLEAKHRNRNYFDFFAPPEFPEDISTWTKDDWFQYDLKYSA